MKKTKLLLLTSAILLVSCRIEDSRINTPDFGWTDSEKKGEVTQFDIDLCNNLLYKITPLIFEMYKGKSVTFSVIDLITTLGAISSMSSDDQGADQILNLLGISNTNQDGQKKLDESIKRILRYSYNFASPTSSVFIDESYNYSGEVLDDKIKLLTDAYRFQLFNSTGDNSSTFTDTFNKFYTNKILPEEIEKNTFVMTTQFSSAWDINDYNYRLFRNWFNGNPDVVEKKMYAYVNPATFLKGDIYKSHHPDTRGFIGDDYAATVISNNSRTNSIIQTQLIVPTGDSTPELLSKKLLTINDSYLPGDSSFEFPTFEVNSVIDFKPLLESLGLSILFSKSSLSFWELVSDFKIESLLQVNSTRIDQYGINISPYKENCQVDFPPENVTPSPELPKTNVTINRPFIAIVSSVLPISVTQVYSLNNLEETLATNLK